MVDPLGHDPNNQDLCICPMCQQQRRQRDMDQQLYYRLNRPDPRIAELERQVREKDFMIETLRLQLDMSREYNPKRPFYPQYKPPMLRVRMNALRVALMDLTSAIELEGLRTKEEHPCTK